MQIETPRALEQLEAIAVVPGVDALFLGPTDLSGGMGHQGDAAHPEVREALLDAARRCNALGKPIGTLASSVDAAVKFVEASFDFVALASDLGLMLSQVRASLAEWKRSFRR
ncbi:hypothetical protein J7E70_21850 [Variovorax paradoxus]|nr:hypothetical protein [Variovorax paradoxus]